MSDAGFYIRVRETATNAAGSAASASPATTQITVPAGNTVAPTLTGTATRGSRLTGIVGTWIGNPAPTLTKAWYRCDEPVSPAVEPQDGCTVIAGAIDLSYQLTDTDLEKYIVFGVTGTNPGRSLLVLTGSSNMVTVPTLNTALPTVSGTYAVGSTLTGSTGTWQGTPAPVLEYQWMRCSAAADVLRCSTIIEATDLTYTVSEDDAGSWIRFRVTGSNAGAIVVSHSAAPSSAVSGPPSLITEPTVGCDTAAYCAKVGGSLTANRGTWAGLPTPAVSLTWYVCDYPYGFDELGDDCVTQASTGNIANKNSNLQADKYHRVKVVARNLQGEVTAWSATSLSIASAPALVAGSAVTIGVDSEYLEAGSVLTAATGDWTGNPEPEFAYAWAICTTAPATSCTTVIDAVDPEFEVPEEANGKWIKVSVTASNVAGSTVRTAVSSTGVYAAPDLSAAVIGIANAFAGAPVGGAAVGNVLTATDTGITGYPTPTKTYQWQQCDPYYDEVLDEYLVDCEDIDGATSRTYTVGSLDLGHKIRVLVAVSNESGTEDAQSDATSNVIDKPIATIDALVSSSPSKGALLIKWSFNPVQDDLKPTSWFTITIGNKTVKVNISQRQYLWTGLPLGVATIAKVSASNWAGFGPIASAKSVVVKK